MVCLDVLFVRRYVSSIGVFLGVLLGLVLM
jgi:hypothetical protein